MKKRVISLLLVCSVLVSLFVQTSLAAYTDGPSNSHYNRTNAATYLAKYVENANDAEYYDYSSDGGDCTNYVSQILRAGGMAMTPAKQYPTDSSWYYYSSDWGYGRTSTWTMANNFRSYWAEINGVGQKKAYEFKSYTAGDFDDDATWLEIYNYLEPGDVVQYVRSSDWDTYHSQAVHRTSYENGEYKVSMGQHTGNGWRNLRTHVSALSSSTIVCLIKIKELTTYSARTATTVSEMSVEELAAESESLFYTAPRSAIMEDEKWARIGAINTELVDRALVDGYEASAEITMDALKTFVDIRYEQNELTLNLIEFTPDLPAESIKLATACSNENERLNTFAAKLVNGNELQALWSEYWNDVVQQTPPSYYK